MDPNVEALIRARKLNSRDAGLARKVSLSPEDLAWDERNDRSPANIKELQTEIGRAKTPEIKRILQDQLQKLMGPRTGLQQDSADTDPDGFGGGETVSAADFAGTAPAKSSKVVSATDFAGGEDEFSPEALRKENISRTLFGDTGKGTAAERTLASLKMGGGEAAALADMVLSLPGFVMGVGAQLGGTIQAAARGVPLAGNGVTAYSVGREAGKEFSEPFMNPIKKIFDLFNSGKVYEEAKTSKGMEKFGTLVEEAGEWVEKATEGKVARDAVPMFIETLMVSPMGLGAKTPKEIEFKLRDEMARKTEALRNRGEADAKPVDHPLSPEEFIARVPVQEQINSLLGIRTPAEQAALTRKRRADALEAYGGKKAKGEIPREGQDALAIAEAEGRRTYATPEESAFAAEQRAGGGQAVEAGPTGLGVDFGPGPEVGQQARSAARQERARVDAPEPVEMGSVIEAMQKEPEQRTREETEIIRRWNQQGGPASVQRGALFDVEKDLGKYSDKDLKALGLTREQMKKMLNEEALPHRMRYLMTAGGVAAGSLAAMKLFESLGSPDVDEKKTVPQPEPRPTEDGTYLANGAQGFEKLAPLLLAAGWVKKPGGMWHPGAVKRLAEPLRYNLTDGVSVARDSEIAVKAIEEKLGIPRTDIKFHERDFIDEYAKTQSGRLENWSDRAISNYLNKYAGTERDPLKDVEIPDGNGQTKWSELTDKLVQGDKVEGPRGPETQWRITDRGRNHQDYSVVPALQSITSYLSHVGDYLRQNVDPAKLQQYDLVRAVQETAKNDARVAKEMEKAAASSMKDLPVYKEYPDGMKWVELKLPEKLTQEQAKGVRKATREELQDAYPHDMPPVGEMEGYIAVGADGKKITNTYTDQWAVGRTPEEAYLAGRLAEEGNQMGHCVGGYCEGVAAGESKIYSLRDAKGKSHVTIEVDPPRNASSRHGFDPRGDKETFTDDILQIKGKQNRAPNAEYLPYVQDFVKSGKWGEVGDLHNSGLITREGIRKQYAVDHPFNAVVDKAFPGAEYIDSKAADALWDQHTGNVRQGFRNQQGKIDQKLLMGLGTLGLGATIGGVLSDDPIAGSLLGTLASSALFIPGAKRRLQEVAKGAEYGLGLLSTRIGDLSPALLKHARDYERRLLTESSDYLHKEVPFMKALDRLPETQRKSLDAAILTNNPTKIAELMKGNPELVDAWRQARNVLKDLGAQLQNYGRFKVMKDDYFPRLVKDLDGLKAALSQEQRGYLEGVIKEAEDKAMKTRGTPLTNVELSDLINKELISHRRPTTSQPGFAKQRGIKEVTEELLPFYHTPAESLYAYTRAAVQDLETARFFGKDLVQKKINGQNFIDLDTSVGNVVGSELKAGKINAEQAQQLIDMLKSRFTAGDRSPNRLISEVKNLGNMGLLGNVVSAATQLSDTAMAIYAQDLRSTLTAVGRQLTGREKIGANDFGLADHIAEEFISPTKTADWLNKMFKYSGFSAIDRFGKSIHLGAALERAERLSRTSAGIKELNTKYGEAYGKEMPELVQDLRNGELTERVRSLLFSELSDMQPVSKLELPQAYLDHPNGRIVYMLKTFMLKQMDIVRRDVGQEFKKGNVAKALRNGTEMAIILGLAGATTDMIKDFMMGKDPHLEGTDVLENVLKTFGWGEFVRDKISKGHPVEALAGMAVPPYRMIDDIIRMDPRAVQYIPVIGKLFYNWELGGREEAEIRDAKKAKKAGREVELSPRTEEYLEKKRERQREKKEAR